VGSRCRSDSTGSPLPSRGPACKGRPRCRLPLWCAAPSAYHNLARYHILVDDIYFANIRFSPEYEKAIEAKQVAQQQVETQKQVLAQREIEAQQKVATAKGEAESIFVVAQEQAKANEVLAHSVTPILVSYKSIERWNGILPQVSGGALPFLELGKLPGWPETSSLGKK
jgi:hypothetical protein